MQALWDRVQKKGVLGADFDGSLAGALAGMELFLTHPASDYSNRSPKNRSKGGQVIRQLRRVSIPVSEFQKPWVPKSVLRLSAFGAPSPFQKSIH